jgi:hypothetical protein
LVFLLDDNRSITLGDKRDLPAREGIKGFYIPDSGQFTGVYARAQPVHQPTGRSSPKTHRIAGQAYAK